MFVSQTYSVNPCCTEKYILSQKQRCLEMQKIKCIDLKGNPIIIRAIVVFRVNDVIKASLEVQDYSSFVLTQSTAVLKSVSSKYPYESSDGSESLKEDAAAITHELITTLQAKVQVAGISVIDFVINELSYAPEIAQVSQPSRQVSSWRNYTSLCCFLVYVGASASRGSTWRQKTDC